MAAPASPEKTKRGEGKHPLRPFRTCHHLVGLRFYHQIVAHPF
jgi:hypothetical protein